MTLTTTMNPTQPSSQDETGFPKIPTRITEPDASMPQAAPIPEVAERLGRLEKHLASVHRICCEAYLSQGSYDEALIHQQIAAQLDQENVEYRNQLGYLRYLTGDDGATSDFEFVIRSDPSNPEGWFNLGMIRFGLGNFAEAEQCFTKAAELAPGDAEVWNNLGVARFQLGHAAEASSCFQRALEIEPDNEDARANLQSV